MRTRQSKSTGTLQKVCECLYRYSSNGVYYARFESGGKEIRRSLRTTDRRSAQPALGWLKQERQEVDGQVSRSIMTHLPARETVAPEPSGQALIITKRGDLRSLIWMR